eukprot:12408675-Karenia_brevis.AAC.1
MLDEYADLSWRRKLPETGAGMPLRPGFGAPKLGTPEEMLNRPEEDDEEFDIYMVGFIDAVEILEKLRKPWLEKVPMDDPMHADELTVRSKEKSVMKDLAKRGAPSRVIKNAHLLGTRLAKVPEAKVTESGFVDN